MTIWVDEIGGDGCVLCLSFNEGSGTTAYDRSGYNNNGTIHGATWTSGVTGSALSFEGDDYVDLPISTLGNWNQLTYEVWAKISQYPEDGTWPPFIGSQTDAYYRNINLGIWENTGHLHLEIDTDNGNYPMEGNLSIPLNKWFYAVLIYDGASLIEYINGIKGKSISASGNLKDVSLLHIGQQYTFYFNGIIDSVRIYNRALSREEIQAHFRGARLLPLRGD